MEFYLVVLIFITCMIALALLIYYCQEYRNPKYSFTDNQRDISAIALAIGLPGLQQPGEFRAVPHSPGFKSAYTSPPGVPPGFVLNETQSAPNPANDLPPPYPKPPPREYMHKVIIPEDTSDDSSTSSEQIYYAPKTAAYSVAKRMSMSASAVRRMSAAAVPMNSRASITADVAAFLVAKRMTKNFLQRRGTSTPANNDNDGTDDTQKNKTVAPISDNTVADSTDSKAHHSQQENGETVQYKSTGPQLSESASERSLVSRTGDVEDPKNRRSGSPYIPASVIAFHLKNRTARSGSPYKPFQNSNLCIQTSSDGLPVVKDSESPSTNPFPPTRTKRPSLKPTENHPLKSINNSSKQSEYQSEDASVPKRSESLPPKYSKSRPTKRSESLPPKENTLDQTQLTSSEMSYRSHSPTPLHTVEEED